MTLCNSIVQRTAGYLMADAGVWGADGSLLELHPKLCILAPANAVAAVRGSSGIPAPEWPLWRSIASVADIFDRTAGFVKHVKARVGERYSTGSRLWHDLEVTVVFWDQDQRLPRAIQMNTADPGLAEGYAGLQRDYRPYSWYGLPTLTLAPTIAAWDSSWPDLGGVQDEEKFDVRSCAAEVVAAQRSLKHQIDGHTYSTVAGWVDMAVVTADGVAVERVVTWPEDQPIHRWGA